MLLLAFETVSPLMNAHSPFELMQRAVDIVQESQHEVNKVAATLAGVGADGRPFAISRTNHWPEAIERTLGREARIGDSSGTVHAEVACLLAALEAGHATQGAALYVTDPFCPNCAKNIAEAGIMRVHIDHKGFAKDFAERRGDHFRDMSLEICEKAGISVYEINRKAKTLRRIYEPGDGYLPPEDSPAESLAVPVGGYGALVAEKIEESGTSNFAMALAADREGRIWALYVHPHLAMGFTNADPPDFHESRDSKYNFMIGPTNRLLMQAARRGLVLDKSSIYTARVPTARELVNLVGAGITHLAVGNLHASRDENGLKALETLEKAGILRSRPALEGLAPL